MAWLHVNANPVHRVLNLSALTKWPSIILSSRFETVLRVPCRENTGPLSAASLHHVSFRMEKEIAMFIINNGSGVCNAGFASNKAPSACSPPQLDAPNTRVSRWAWARRTPIYAEDLEQEGHPSPEIAQRARHCHQQGQHGEDLAPHLQGTLHGP